MIGNIVGGGLGRTRNSSVDWKGHKLCENEGDVQTTEGGNWRKNSMPVSRSCPEDPMHRTKRSG